MLSSSSLLNDTKLKVVKIEVNGRMRHEKVLIGSLAKINLMWIQDEGLSWKESRSFPLKEWKLTINGSSTEILVDQILISMYTLGN